MAIPYMTTTTPDYTGLTPSVGEYITQNNLTGFKVPEAYVMPSYPTNVSEYPSYMTNAWNAYRAGVPLDNISHHYAYAPTVNAILNDSGYNSLPSAESFQLNSVQAPSTLGRWWNKTKDAYDKVVNGVKTVGNQVNENAKQTTLTDKGNAVMGAVGTLMNAYNAHKSNKLAEKQLAFNREVYETNLTNQRKMINSHLEDRQKTRVANNPLQHESVASYMSKYGV